MQQAPPGIPPSGDTGNAGAALWHHGDFMKLWVGQTVSLLGSSLTRLALPLIAAVTLAASPAEMGLLNAAGTLPSLLVGLFAGVWVDRYRRRKLLIAADIGRALLLTTVPVAAVLGLLSIYHLFAVAFLAGALTVVFSVAYPSYLPAVIDRSRLVEGNSKLQLSGSITAVAGPSLAGLVIQVITAPMAIALDALSFLASALLLVFIRRREDRPQMTLSPIAGQVREGLGLVAANPLLRACAGCMATSNFMSNMFFALYMIFGTRDLRLNAAQLGLVYGIGASGAIVGAALAPWAATRFGAGRAIVVGALIGSLEVVPAALATATLAVPLLILSSLLGNFGWVLYNVNEMSLRQAITPMSLQGRMHATLNFLVAGMLPLGALAGGALGEVIGVRQTIALAACGSLLSFLWVLFSPIRNLAAIPHAAGV